MIRTTLSCLLTLLLLYSSAYAQSPIPLGLPPLPNAVDNPKAMAKIELGELLFNDKRLSADGKISCASCHQTNQAFADGLTRAEGIRNQQGVRNTPSLLNVAYFTTLFLDGRRESLEAQALDPLFNAVEHGLSGPEQVLAVVRSDRNLVTHIRQVFAVTAEDIQMEHIAKAIAAFERTLLAGDSAFDRFQYGRDTQSLSPAARKGMELFKGRAGCAACHTIGEDSALFTDNSFHSLGVGFKAIESKLAEIAQRYIRSEKPSEVLTPQELSELGRFIVTRKPEDIACFKTPSLRNIALTAPYMHDGSVATLEEAVELEIYYRGARTQRPLILTPIEKANLVTFLKALTSSHLLSTDSMQKDTPFLRN